MINKSSQGVPDIALSLATAPWNKWLTQMTLFKTSSLTNTILGDKEVVPLRYAQGESPYRSAAISAAIVKGP